MAAVLHQALGNSKHLTVLQHLQSEVEVLPVPETLVETTYCLDHVASDHHCHDSRKGHLTRQETPSRRLLRRPRVSEDKPLTIDVLPCAVDPNVVPRRQP